MSYAIRVAFLSLALFVVACGGSGGTDFHAELAAKHEALAAEHAKMEEAHAAMVHTHESLQEALQKHGGDEDLLAKHDAEHAALRVKHEAIIAKHEALIEAHAALEKGHEAGGDRAKIEADHARMAGRQVKNHDRKVDDQRVEEPDFGRLARRKVKGGALAQKIVVVTVDHVQDEERQDQGHHRQYGPDQKGTILEHGAPVTAWRSSRRTDLGGCREA